MCDQQNSSEQQNSISWENPPAENNPCKTNYKYWEDYCSFIKNFSKKVFFAAIIFAFLGTIITCCGLVCIFLNRASFEIYTLCAIGISIEIISAVLFCSYNKSQKNIIDCYNKIIFFQNIIIACEKAEKLEENDKTEEYKLIINELIKKINSHFINGNQEDDE